MIDVGSRVVITDAMDPDYIGKEGIVTAKTKTIPTSFRILIDGKDTGDWQYGTIRERLSDADELRLTYTLKHFGDMISRAKMSGCLLKNRNIIMTPQELKNKINSFDAFVITTSPDDWKLVFAENELAYMVETIDYRQKLNLEMSKISRRNNKVRLHNTNKIFTPDELEKYIIELNVVIPLELIEEVNITNEGEK